MLKHLLLLPSACCWPPVHSPSTTSAKGDQPIPQREVAFEKQLGIPGIMSSKIRLDEMQSRIGRRQADRVELDAAGDLQVASPWQPADEDPPLLSARPDYVAEQGAIYLRDLELISVKTEPVGVGTALTRCCPPSTSRSRCSSPRPPSTGLTAVARTKPGSRIKSKPSRWSPVTGHPLQAALIPNRALFSSTPGARFFFSSSPLPHNAHHSHLDS